MLRTLKVINKRWMKFRGGCKLSGICRNDFVVADVDVILVKLGVIFIIWVKKIHNLYWSEILHRWPICNTLLQPPLRCWLHPVYSTECWMCKMVRSFLMKVMGKTCKSTPTSNAWIARQSRHEPMTGSQIKYPTVRPPPTMDIVWTVLATFRCLGSWLSQAWQPTQCTPNPIT